MTTTADLIRELQDDFPAVDVTTVVFSRDFAGVGCCVIPQEKVLEIISHLQDLQPKADCLSQGDWNYTGPGPLGPSCKD